MTKFLDLTGVKFGRLVALRRHAHSDKSGRIRWECECDCGNKTIVLSSLLMAGQVKSCRCFMREDAGNRHRRHGMTGTPEYRAWSAMKKRCNNAEDKMYHRYGGRGISVCYKWLAFSSFFSDMGERPSSLHSLERKNSDGNYEPENCIWATRKEQSRNRPSFHRYVTYKGQTVQFAVALEMADNKVKRETARNRLNAGWSVEDALEQEVK